MKPTEQLSEWYFRPKRFEFGGKLHVWLGVVLFKRALMALAKPAPGSKEPAYWLVSRDAEGLRAFERKTRRNEAFHLLVLVPCVVGLILAGTSSPWLSATLCLVIGLNFYPILLQRYNRIRILRALARHG